MIVQRLILVALAFGAAAITGCASAPSAGVSFDNPKNEIVIAAVIAGTEEARFMVDSGVDPSVIDLALAERLGLLINPGRVAEASGSGDERGIEIREANIRALEIGGARFGDIDAVAADLSPFAERLGAALDGILGYSFLQGRAVRIDYAKQRLDIAPSAAFLPPLDPPAGERYAVPMAFVSADDRTPAVDIEINGEALRVSIDTGSSLGVELYHTAVDRLGLDSRTGETKTILGARGKATVVEGELRNIAVGPVVIAAAPASFSTRAHDPRERTGNLGNRFLQNFVLTLDYANGEIIFERRAEDRN